MSESPFARAETFKGSPLTEAEIDLLKSMLARIERKNERRLYPTIKELSEVAEFERKQREA